MANGSATRFPGPLWWTLGLSSVLILAIALFLAWFNWNMLRGPIAREASARTGRQVRIDGDLKVHLWSWSPSATVDGLKVGNPAWMGGGDVADIDRLKIAVKFWPLLTGRIELPLVQAERPNLQLYRDASGPQQLAVRPLDQAGQAAADPAFHHRRWPSAVRRPQARADHRRDHAVERERRRPRLLPSGRRTARSTAIRS